MVMVFGLSGVSYYSYITLLLAGGPSLIFRMYLTMTVIISRSLLVLLCR